MTTEEISRIIEKINGHHYTKQTVSNITAAVVGDIQAFNHRKLSKRYAVICLDATHLPVRRDTVTKEALYFALGITPEGYKEILSYSLYTTESAHNWEIVLSDLRSRGVEESLLFVTDGLTGITDAISSVFPKAKHQSCWVHFARNVSHSVRVNYRTEVLSNRKSVYDQDTLENALDALHQFINTWDKRYPKVTALLKNNPSLFTFLSFTKEIRASIYTTNLIESFNKHLKRYTKRKEQFPNGDSLIRFIGTYTGDYNQRFQMRIHKVFKLVTAELIEIFN